MMQPVLRAKPPVVYWTKAHRSGPRYGMSVQDNGVHIHAPYIPEKAFVLPRQVWEAMRQKQHGGPVKVGKSEFMWGISGGDYMLQVREPDSITRISVRIPEQPMRELLNVVIP